MLTYMKSRVMAHMDHGSQRYAHLNLRAIARFPGTKYGSCL